jgi:hypothetical protein
MLYLFLRHGKNIVRGAFNQRRNAYEPRERPGRALGWPLRLLASEARRANVGVAVWAGSRKHSGVPGRFDSSGQRCAEAAGNRGAGLMGEGSLQIQGRAHGQAAALEHVGVDHGRLDVFVAQQFLDGADVVAVFEQVGGE